MHLKKLSKCGLAVTTSLLLTASFPKFNLSWLAWVALVPLLFAIRDESAWNRFRFGFLAGLIHYFTLGYWLIHTLQTYGYLPIYVCLPIFFLLGAYLASYWGVFCLVLGYGGCKPLAAIIGIPVLWTALEYLRAFALTGVPWEFLGHSQYRNLTLIQMCDLVGVYGVSFLIALANGVGLMLLIGFGKRQWFGHEVNKRHLAAYATVLAFLLGFSLVYGNQRIKSMDRQIDQAPKTRLALVQGNIEQDMKWDKRFQNKTVEKYLRLSGQVRAQQPDLIIWPETAAPFYLKHDVKLTQRLILGIMEIGVDLLVGSPSFRRGAQKVDYFNSAYLIDADGVFRGRYDKVHLVPFGEYVPMREYLPFLGKLVEQVGDFEPGESGHTLAWRDTHLGVLICYELMFPELSRMQVNQKADLLINITNDAWYGDTAAPHQHFSIAVFRAIENRRALIRSANTGISGFIDPVGRIIAPTRLFTEAVAVEAVPVMRETTLYTQHGDRFAQICLMLSLIVVIWRISLNFKNKHV